jgi:hypothetical protein
MSFLRRLVRSLERTSPLNGTKGGGSVFKNWTDVSSGKMTVMEVFKDVIFQMYHRAPKRLIVDIQFRKGKGYFTKIWMSNKDFKTWRR